MKIPLLPADAFHYSELAKLSKTGDSPFGTSYGHEKCFFATNARTLIDIVLGRLNLSRTDVISILTTSDERYVSTCLTITAFNHASISRTVLPETKVALVVHEHGYLQDGIERFIAAMRSNGIFVIEDCAHVLGTNGDGPVPGTLGDVAVFSLPKVLPVHAGGLLLANGSSSAQMVLSGPMPAVAQEVKDRFQTFVPYWRSLNEARLMRHQMLTDALGKSRVRAIQSAAPWLAYLYDVKINFAFLPEIEFGASFLKQTYLIPTNPLVPLDVFEELLANISITQLQ